MIAVNLYFSPIKTFTLNKGQSYCFHVVFVHFPIIHVPHLLTRARLDFPGQCSRPLDTARTLNQAQQAKCKNIQTKCFQLTRRGANHVHVGLYDDLVTLVGARMDEYERPLFVHELEGLADGAGHLDGPTAVQKRLRRTRSSVSGGHGKEHDYADRVGHSD